MASAPSEASGKLTRRVGADAQEGEPAGSVDPKIKWKWHQASKSVMPDLLGPSFRAARSHENEHLLQVWEGEEKLRKTVVVI